MNKERKKLKDIIRALENSQSSTATKWTLKHEKATIQMAGTFIALLFTFLRLSPEWSSFGLEKVAAQIPIPSSEP